MPAAVRGENDALAIRRKARMRVGVLTRYNGDRPIVVGKRTGPMSSLRGGIAHAEELRRSLGRNEMQSPIWEIGIANKIAPTRVRRGVPGREVVQPFGVA